mmetsp:Transcript_23184/g.59593  ORF Transcript_23184/g.59593 Transcript_23184/m.59593 type:complete len:229 (-) Transcript_23184:313-999(-)
MRPPNRRRSSGGTCGAVDRQRAAPSTVGMQSDLGSGGIGSGGIGGTNAPPPVLAPPQPAPTAIEIAAHLPVEPAQRLAQRRQRPGRWCHRSGRARAAGWRHDVRVEAVVARLSSRALLSASTNEAAASAVAPAVARFTWRLRRPRRFQFGEGGAIDSTAATAGSSGASPIDSATPPLPVHACTCGRRWLERKDFEADKQRVPEPCELVCHAGGGGPLSHPAPSCLPCG